MKNKKTNHAPVNRVKIYLQSRRKTAPVKICHNIHPGVLSPSQQMKTLQKTQYLVAGSWLRSRICPELHGIEMGAYRILFLIEEMNLMGEGECRDGIVRYKVWCEDPRQTYYHLGGVTGRYYKSSSPTGRLG